MTMTMVTTRRILAAVLLLLPVSLVHAKVRCFSIFDCKENVGTGSHCIDGFCSNPYYEKGCLPSRLKDHFKVRTCTSEDPPSAALAGHCQPSALGYTEVRVSSQNWESVFFTAWIIQILLGELMDVPVTIESSSETAKVNFYDLEMSFGYGKANDWDAMRLADKIKDCRKVKDNENYTACTHVVPEVWTGHKDNLRKLQDEQVIETPGSIGALGQQMWFMRRKTAEADPTLTSYLGMRGQQNRKKLADTFKRPTTWSDYCNLVSPNNCSTPDKFAERAPVAGEEGKYHEAGVFSGYFRATEQNNCTLHPTTCTGHIVDFPCGWASFVVPQTHHLDIALESNGNQPGSNGYSYGEMVQIWNAANATDSNVLLQWWRPEALYQQFLGTDSEFLGVTLPPPTQDCIEHRVNPIDRCSDDEAVRLGDPLGSCAEAPHALLKVISSALFDISFDPLKPEALHSPAYETIKNFRLSDLQMGKVFDYWFEQNNDKWNLDPRDAVCRWVVDNLDVLQSYIPRGHPRVVEDNVDIYNAPVFYIAVVLSAAALIWVSVSTILTIVQRQKSVMRYSQLEFLVLLLIGLGLVSLGALLTALPPSDPICVAISWFVNFGYTLELVPLIVKIAAINRLMVASQQMKRVKLRTSSLFGAVLFFCLLVSITLIVWTFTDPPRREENIQLTDNQAPSGETIIERTYFCSSDAEFWNYMGVSWQLLLLLCASVLAFQTRKMREDMNETKTLAMMIYSQFVFVILRAITYVLDGSLNNSDLEFARSIILSLDVLATTSIYFLPKFLQKESETAAPWLKKGSNGSREQPPAPLNVHTWQSRQTSSHTRGSRPRREIFAESEEEEDDRPVDRISSFCRQSSLRQSSLDYKTKAEWENSESDLGLDEISEKEVESDFGDEDLRTDSTDESP